MTFWFCFLTFVGRLLSAECPVCPNQVELADEAEIDDIPDVFETWKDFTDIKLEYVMKRKDSIGRVLSNCHSQQIF